MSSLAHSIPRYVGLHESGELHHRVEQAIAELINCRVCPWNCGINRLHDERKLCRTGRHARVANCFPHFGEEDCLRGWNGSGTIFFAWCNMRCVFCQNHDISQAPAGIEVSPAQLANMMLDLQERGCHNINLVTPEHVVPQILEALPVAIKAGLRLPIVYNTSGFDSLRSLELMDGIIDIYMPDFKINDPKRAFRYLKCREYPEAARRALREMHRQVGDLVIDENGLAARGVLVRHLVMPGCSNDARDIMRFLAEELSTETFVNIMGQYRPDGRVSDRFFSEINRRPTITEIESGYASARAAGLHRFEK